MQWKMSIEKMLQMLLRNTQNGAGYPGSALTFWLALINLLVTSLTASCSRTSHADSLPVITSVRPSNTPAWTSPSQYPHVSLVLSLRSWCDGELRLVSPAPHGLSACLLGGECVVVVMMMAGWRGLRPAECVLTRG